MFVVFGSADRRSGVNRRRAWVSGRLMAVGAAALVSTWAMCGAAGAMNPYTVHVTVPSTVKKANPFKVMVHGYSANTSQLTAFVDKQSCATTAAGERAHTSALQIINKNVVLSYSVTKTLKANTLGKHYVCAYLTGLPPQSLPRAHATASYTVT